MRSAICLLLVGLLVATGCNRAEEARRQRQKAEEQLRQVSDRLKETEQQEVSQESEFVHRITTEVEYYTGGPQQGRPADGTFAADTRVALLEEAGSYTLVRSESGVEGYVAADAVAGPGIIRMDVVEIVEGGNQFAFDLYQRLRSGESNLFFSPSSISVALAMTYAGAEGETATEMAETLHFPLADEDLHDRMQAMQEFCTTPIKNRGIQLHLANRLWGQQGYEFLPEFLRITRENYGAELAPLDFNLTEESRQTINLWVEEQTQQKIVDVIPSGALVSDTKLVLTNAVYLKGDWNQPFDEERTEDEDFHLTDRETVTAPLMHQQEEFRYAAVDGLQILELPYGDETLSMIVLLPDAIDGLADLETQLMPETVDQWMDRLKTEEVKVYLPKFEMSSQFDLSGTLSSMGMESAFDDTQADFSDMTGGRDLFISAVLHKAFVDVNEEGTEAAAATAVIMEPTAAPFEEPKEPPVFRADHPFVFLIRDNRNDAILFLGRVVNPS